MANTTPVYARIETNLKDKAENILMQLGITPASAIQMLYSQIVINRGLPFEAKLPSYPTAIGGMTQKEIDSVLCEGLNSGEPINADNVETLLEREFDI